MSRMRVIVLWLALGLLTGVWAKDVAVLAVGIDVRYGYMANRLSEQGIQLDCCGLDQVTPERLKRYHVVILFDMSRIEPQTKDVNHVLISPAGFQRVAAALKEYVHGGGGLYIYGVSFIHMGDYWSNQTLNTFLADFDAKIPFEMLRDEPRETRQPDGGKVLYAQADRIVPHPATEGATRLWYALGPFSYGPWTRPLKLGAAWTPLIFTSPGAVASPIDPERGWEHVKQGAASEIATKPIPIYAARTVGQGRVVLSGGESTISFFGYGFSEFADRHWGRVGMEKGLNGLPSDGFRLLVSSLKWLAEPGQTSGALGGYVRPPKPVFTPRHADLIAWETPGPVGTLMYYKGIFGAIPALGGGTGTVAEWAAAAKAQRLQYLVLCGEYAKMKAADYEQLKAECAAATTADLAVLPAIITRDDQDNTFIQMGARAWPKDTRRSIRDPKRIQEHLQYWMTDNNFAMRAPCYFSRSRYPTWLHTAYDTFAVRTYEDNTLVDEQVPGFQFNEVQGDRCRIIAVNLLHNPAQLAGVPEFTYLQARNLTHLADSLVNGQFSGGALSYVSTGPQVRYWAMDNYMRQTFGEPYVPGTERWRARLSVATPVGLKTVTIYNGTKVYRRFAVSGTEAQVAFDGVHDNRYVFSAIIEDVNGGKAMTGALETGDMLFRQIFCSDRCNIMGGVSTIRHAKGEDETIAATMALYKTGRLLAGSVSRREELPGIDGSGGGAKFAFYPSLKLRALDGRSEVDSPVHQINRPYENADCIIFDTPIFKRSPATENYIYGHNPYITVRDPKVGARMVQYNFYRYPVYPSPALVDFSFTGTDPKGITLTKGDLGYHLIYFHPQNIRPNGGWGAYYGTERFTRLYFRCWLEKPGDILILRKDGREAQRLTDALPAGQYATPTLHAGDSILFAGWNEVVCVVDGMLDLVLERIPSEDSWLLFAGTAQGGRLKYGETQGVRVMTWKIADGMTEKDLRAAWQGIVTGYGLHGGAPGYAVTTSRGRVTGTRYLLELAAKDGGVQTKIGQAKLPQRLPVKVTGLNANWTVGKVDLARNTWVPLGVWQGAAYTTVDTRESEHDLYIGQLVTCSDPAIPCTLLPANAGGHTMVEAHNPGTKPVTITIAIPVSTFLAPAQQHTVTIPAGTTARVMVK